MGGVEAGAIKAAVLAQRGMIAALFDRLAAGSPGNPGITRDTYGPGEDFAHRVFAEVAAEAGLAVTTDHAANSYATWAGSDRALPSIFTGSHLDSVPQGGNFDGAAGVLAGLAAIAALKACGVRLERDITVMAVRAEESVWFAVSYIGSRAALGTLPDGALEAKRVDTGKTLAEHIAASGGNVEAIHRGKAHLDPASLHAFVEVHIEQAPSLVEAGLPIAICTGIPGNFRFPDARIVGRYDHVGTPRRFRHDAAMAGAEFAMALDRLWAEHEAAGTPIAITFGRFHTDAEKHGLTTVAGEFRFSLDVRGYEASVLARLETALGWIVADIEARRGVTFVLGPRAAAAVGPVAPAIVAGFTRAADSLGIASMPLGSPASHDSAAFAAAGVPVGMIFVRNPNGSHNPLEAMAIDDFLEAVMVLASWMAEHGN